VKRNAVDFRRLQAWRVNPELGAAGSAGLWPASGKRRPVDGMQGEALRSTLHAFPEPLPLESTALRVKRPERRAFFAIVLAAVLAALAPSQTPAALKKATEGRDHLMAGRLDEALASFKDAQIDMPDAPELALDIGLALYKLGRFDEAASSFAAATAAKDVKLEALARFHLGNTFFRQGNLEGALAALNGSLRLVPDDEDAKFNREIVVRHLKELERQKKDEEKKHEIE
jgi:tetratricopeptide (TPR) repeat protein